MTCPFCLLPPERDALMALLDEAKRRLDKEFKPDGYNIGINDGGCKEGEEHGYYFRG